MPAKFTREDDERHLFWLAARAAGVTIRQIAAAAGVTRNTVMGVLRRIDADFAKSLNHGDPDGR